MLDIKEHKIVRTVFKSCVELELSQFETVGHISKALANVGTDLSLALEIADNVVHSDWRSVREKIRSDLQQT